MKIIADVRGIHAGRPGLVVASGPSVSRLEAGRLDCVTIAVNGGILSAPDSDYFCTADPTVPEHGYYKLVQDGRCEVWWRDEPGHAVPEQAKVSPDRIIAYKRNGALSLSRDADRLITGINSAHCAAHAAAVMGCSPIYLIGCDCMYSGGKKYAWEISGDERGRHKSGLCSRWNFWQRHWGKNVRDDEYDAGSDGITDGILSSAAHIWEVLAGSDVDLRDCSHGALTGRVPQHELEELYA